MRKDSPSASGWTTRTVNFERQSLNRNKSYYLGRRKCRDFPVTKYQTRRDSFIGVSRRLRE
ncbi:hypothetical protein V1478_004518 [Vespula squamosa]|uniref:Uncharacterized protein n=1 Tax=Vespula squamosa TaxID=30214 RepID=A0ABD2BGQ5_VESSQ